MDNDGINDAFETNPAGQVFSVEDSKEARTRDQKAWGDLAHRADWDQTPGAGLSYRNEAHVKGKLDEIMKCDWSDHGINKQE